MTTIKKAKNKYSWSLKPCFCFLMLMCLGAQRAHSQVDTSFAKRNIDFQTFLGLVTKNNAAYLAQKYNVSLAEAQVEIAKMFPDPEIGFSYFDNGERRMKLGYGFETNVSTTIELGKKRKARIELAKSESEMARYLLQDFYRNLRADASISFLTALQYSLLLEVQNRSYQKMKQISDSDSIRFLLGSITKIDAQQSRLEAGTILNDLFQAESDWKSSLAQLNYWISESPKDGLLNPKGNFKNLTRDFVLADLIITAQNNRADLLAALQQKEVARKYADLIKANRIGDIGIGSGITYNSYASNVIAPTPSFTTISAGVSVPLKISNLYKGELKTAFYAHKQADYLFKEVEMLIQNEVVQAYFEYLAYQKQAQQFDKGLLSDAQSVLDGKIYSYQRGETSLLEVLNAQRTFIGIQQGYFQTLFAYAAALVQLERVTGIWDIDF